MKLRHNKLFNLLLTHYFHGIDLPCGFHAHLFIIIINIDITSMILPKESFPIVRSNSKSLIVILTSSFMGCCGVTTSSTKVSFLSFSTGYWNKEYFKNNTVEAAQPMVKKSLSAEHKSFLRLFIKKQIIENKSLNANQFNHLSLSFLWTIANTTTRTTTLIHFNNHTF